MQFQPGEIAGVIWKPLKKYHDPRGWLCELFRDDELPPELHPAMAYISMTEPGVARGPHEHVDQADYFCFLGPSQFKVYLWDARPASPTHGNKQVEIVGEERPMALVVPAGVVHAYKNVGGVSGIVFNAPNRLYKGWHRKGWMPTLPPLPTLPPGAGVDEIRHEDETRSPYVLD
jgi:dTDP-4-dehydrorhamnose 3,5-epimerase